MPARERASLDVLVSRLATRQAGVVGVGRQLVALGLTRGAIKHRVRSGRLLRVHRGVYAVGHHALGDRGRMIAALLAAGPGAVLSHQTAAFLWKLISSLPAFIDVTLTDRAPRRRHGVRIHQTRRLATTIHENLPVTTPAQTLAQLPADELERARAQALILGLIPRSADDQAEPARSALERGLLPALRKARLPRPLVNTHVLGHEVDFFWPEHGLIVETDGWGTHGTRGAFEDDRAEDATLQAHGYTVTRFTLRQVTEETLLVTVRIAQLLARSG